MDKSILIIVVSIAVGIGTLAIVISDDPLDAQSKHPWAIDTKTSKEIAIGNIKKSILSGLSHEESIEVIRQQVEQHNLKPFSAIVLQGLKDQYQDGEKEYATFGSPEQRTRETYDSVMEGNPSLNPQLITINGMLAYAVDSCPDCGMQTANFSDGTMIQKSASTETKIKFIDENGVTYMLKTTLPLSELIKVAESLQ